MRIGAVYVNNVKAGYIQEDVDGYVFFYIKEYLERKDATAVSLTLPLSNNIYKSEVLFPFFDGLIPEGYLFSAAINYFKIDYRDRMGLLLKTCKDVIGNVSIEEVVDYER